MTIVNLIMTVDIPEGENVEEEIWDIISRTQHEFAYLNAEVSQVVDDQDIKKSKEES